MRFECIDCEKLVHSKDVILVVVHGGFGNVQGFDAYCEECYEKTKKKEA